MQAIAEELDAIWRDKGQRVIYVPEYYNWDDRARWLKGRGFNEVDEGFHDELSVEAIIMNVDPAAIRLQQRRAVGRDTINGVRIDRRVERAGHALIDHIAETTVSAIRTKLSESAK